MREAYTVRGVRACLAHEGQRDYEREVYPHKWVEIWSEDVRCRFLGQEIAAGDPRTDVFAITPPSFLAKIILLMKAGQ